MSGAKSRPSTSGGEVGSSLVGAAPALGVRQIFRRFWPETRRLRGRLFVSLVLVMVSPALDTVGIWLFKVLVDDVFTPQDFTLFPLIAAAYLAITLVEGVVSFTDEYLSTWVGERFLLGLRTKVFAHLHRLSSGFLERRQLGDVLSRLTSDVEAIEELVLSGVTQVISYLLKIVLFTGALFYLNWKLALVALIAAPLFGVVSRYFSRRIKAASREKRRRSGAIAAVAEESLSNVALVQAYGRQRDETKRFHEEGLGSFRAQLSATRLQAAFGPLIELFEVAGVLLVLGFAVSELASNQITLGGLLVFIAYLTQLYGPIRGIGGLYNSIYAASASAERIIELLDEKPLVTEPANPRPLDRARGTLRVEQASFTYPGTAGPAVAGLSFTVAPGQKVALVGPSGAGKSTLAKLLLRAYDPDDGRIRLDGTDLRELALSDLRRNIVVVLQETLVFDGTIRDNILWGKPGADEAEMIAAAKAADAHEFIMLLPDGYGTRIGQRGRMLSGGQRQRIAIARAIIRDAPVLLLDEPTTGLDAASTQRILEPLRRLMSGRTTIIISHNLRTVTDADQIVFLDQGKITGVGTHAELLTRHPGYAYLYRLHHHQNGPSAVGRGPAPRLAPRLAPRNAPHPHGNPDPVRWPPGPPQTPGPQAPAPRRPPRSQPPLQPSRPSTTPQQPPSSLSGALLPSPRPGAPLPPPRQPLSPPTPPGGRPSGGAPDAQVNGRRNGAHPQPPRAGRTFAPPPAVPIPRPRRSWRPAHEPLPVIELGIDGNDTRRDTTHGDNRHSDNRYRDNRYRDN